MLFRCAQWRQVSLVLSHMKIEIKEMKKITLALSVIIFQINAIHAQSHFGIHIGSLDYNSARSHINDLGEQIYVRTEVWGDVYGWKMVKNNAESVDFCNENCIPTPSTNCDCNPGDYYYSHPESRDRLNMGPKFIPFYEDTFPLFITVSTSRYEDDLPKNPLIPNYPHEPGDMDIYRNYISYLVQKLSNDVKYWQIGNEIDLSMFWMGTPQEYADMLVFASGEIRQHCADCKVGLSFANPNVTPEDWYTAIGNVCDSFDFIDAHFYGPNFIEEGQLDRWKTTCPGKEFISTETGVLDTIGPVPQNAGGSLENQSRDLIKYNTLMFAEGYNKIYMYLMDTDYGMGDIPENIFLHNGLIDEISKDRKSAFYSYKTMIDKVDYFTSVSELAEGQYKYTFSDNDPVYVLWCDSGTVTLPEEILDLGRVTVTDYQGNELTKQASEIILTEIQTPVFIEDSPSTSVEDKSSNLDDLNEYYILQNYPNPFNPATKIEYNLPKSNHVILKIFDLTGQEVIKLVDEFQQVGEHEVIWRAEKLPNGIYFYRLQVGDPSASSGQRFSETKKLILLK